MENNQISELPVSFKNLTKLIHFNIKNNKLSDFPPQIIDQRELRYCYLNSNKIKNIDKNHLRGTKLLHVLDINDNPFDDEKLLGNLTGYPHVTYGRQRARNSRSHDDDEEYDSSEDDLTDSEDWENSVMTSELDTSDGTDEERENEVIVNCHRNIYTVR